MVIVRDLIQKVVLARRRAPAGIPADSRRYRRIIALLEASDVTGRLLAVAWSFRGSGLFCALPVAISKASSMLLRRSV